MLIQFLVQTKAEWGKFCKLMNISKKISQYQIKLKQLYKMNFLLPSETRSKSFIKTHLSSHKTKDVIMMEKSVANKCLT